MTFFAAQRDAQREMMAAAANVRGRSPWQDAGRRFVANRAAVTGIAVLMVIAVMALIGPSFSPHAIDDLAWDAIGVAPTREPLPSKASEAISRLVRDRRK